MPYLLVTNSQGEKAAVPYKSILGRPEGKGCWIQAWLWKGDEVQFGAWGMGQRGGPGDRLPKESGLMLGMLESTLTNNV